MTARIPLSAALLLALLACVAVHTGAAAAAAAAAAAPRRETAAVSDEGTLTSPPFDYFVVPFDWPGTYTNGAPNPENVTDFQLHGIWPNFYDGYPADCDNADVFDQTQITPLIADLETVWHDFCPPNDFDWDAGSLWSHEWGKHGTCAIELSEYCASSFSDPDCGGNTLDYWWEDQYDFFNNGIVVSRRAAQLIESLERNGVVPDFETYWDMDKILSELSEIYGVEAVIACDTIYSIYDVCFNDKLAARAHDALTKYTGADGELDVSSVHVPAADRVLATYAKCTPTCQSVQGGGTQQRSTASTTDVKGIKGLLTVYLCYDLSMMPIDCPSNVSYDGSCSGDFLLPAITY